MKTEKMISANEKTSPRIMSAVIAGLICCCLSYGFIMTIGSAFDLDFSIWRVALFSVIASAAFAVLHYLNRKWITLTAAVLPVLILAVLLIFDIRDVRQGLLSFIEQYKNSIVLWYLDNDPGTLPERKAILAFLTSYNLIALSVTTYTLIRRRFIPLSLIFYLPYFICSVTNTRMVPDQIPVAVASIGVFMALFVHVFRRKRKDIAEKMIGILAVPVVLFGVLMVAAFPQQTYDRNQLATDILNTAQETIEKAVNDKDSLIGKIVDIAKNGWRSSVNGRNGSNFMSLYASSTDLDDVGPFNPDQTDILKVYKIDNPDMTRDDWVDYIEKYITDDTDFYFRNHTLYLKVESLDTYEDNKLTASQINMDVYSSLAGNSLNEKSRYLITVTPIVTSSVDIVPYYTDGYFSSGRSSLRVNPYNTTSRFDYVFASSPVPVKTGNIYSDQYIDEYVNSRALAVPESTERALILSGDLPDWYLDVYYGKAAMTDADKVRRVTEFVRDLHPYDKDTDYPPKGADFVPWFVSDAKTGICVHYAATTVILLRMIGVPARYVRGYLDTGSFVDKESIVKGTNAHAWFEFFIPDYGWVIGDSTPGYASDASDYNIDAIANTDPSVESAVFAVDRTPAVPPAESNYKSNDSGQDPAKPTVTPAQGNSAPTATPSPSPTPYAYKANIKVITMDNGLTYWLKLIFLILFGILLLMAIIKAVFALYWTRRFTSDSINDRAIAYYHYYSFTAKFVGAVPFSEVTKIAQKAAFSNEDLTKEEYNELLSLCRRYTYEISETLKGLKWFVYKLLTIKIKEEPDS
ncbi:MAG: hypothetical protein J6X33_07425 [Clostridiales bacterium]|nr:hypothetical protein [Clostridiales bacterium]